MLPACQQSPVPPAAGFPTSRATLRAMFLDPDRGLRLAQPADLVDPTPNPCSFRRCTFVFWTGKDSARGLQRNDEGCIRIAERQGRGKEGWDSRSRSQCGTQICTHSRRGRATHVRIHTRLPRRPAQSCSRRIRLACLMGLASMSNALGIFTSTSAFFKIRHARSPGREEHQSSVDC